ncbi:hypothetical protein D9M68_457180 [compost metagenome]
MVTLLPLFPPTTRMPTPWSPEPPDTVPGLAPPTLTSIFPVPRLCARTPMPFSPLAAIDP